MRRQKDLDATHTKKHGKGYHSYKLSISVEVRHKFIRKVSRKRFFAIVPPLSGFRLDQKGRGETQRRPNEVSSSPSRAIRDLKQSLYVFRLDKADIIWRKFAAGVLKGSVKVDLDNATQFLETTGNSLDSRSSAW